MYPCLSLYFAESSHGGGGNPLRPADAGPEGGAAGGLPPAPAGHRPRELDTDQAGYFGVCGVRWKRSDFAGFRLLGLQ